MARNYKRDAKGRFAKAHSAVGRAAKSVADRQQRKAKYRRTKAYNRVMAERSVSAGLLTKRQSEIARGRANQRAKMEMKGYKVASETTYRGDSRGRKRANGRYEYKVTSYTK